MHSICAARSSALRLSNNRPLCSCLIRLVIPSPLAQITGVPKAKASKTGLWNDEARLIWEDANIIPDVPAAEAKVIVAKSGIVHAVQCGAGPSVKNGTFFRDTVQAAKFKFTRLHSCLIEKKGEDE